MQRIKICGMHVTNSLEEKVRAYIRKEERSKIHGISFHINKLKKEEQIKHKVSRRKDLRKTKAEINELENRQTLEKINEIRGMILKVGPSGYDLRIGSLPVQAPGWQVCGDNLWELSHYNYQDSYLG